MTDTLLAAGIAVSNPQGRVDNTGLTVLDQRGIFFALFFTSLGLLRAGLGIMKWGNGQEAKGKKGG